MNKTISSLLDQHLQPLDQEVKSCTKGTSDFLKKILSKLPGDIILRSMDVAGLSLNILHDGGLSYIMKTACKLKRKICFN